MSFRSRHLFLGWRAWRVLPRTQHSSFSLHCVQRALRYYHCGPHFQRTCCRNILFQCPATVSAVLSRLFLWPLSAETRSYFSLLTWHKASSRNQLASTSLQFALSMTPTVYAIHLSPATNWNRQCGVSNVSNSLQQSKRRPLPLIFLPSSHQFSIPQVSMTSSIRSLSLLVTPWCFVRVNYRSLAWCIRRFW